MAQFNFDATQHKPISMDYTPLPAGWYSALIEDSEIKDTNDGSGNYLSLKFRILESQYEKRKLFIKLNVKNQNKKTEDTANGLLSALSDSIGMTGFTDTIQLHGKPMKVKLKKVAENGKYAATNDITSYAKIDDPKAVSVGASPFAGAQDNAAKQPVWANNAASSKEGPWNKK